MDVNIKVDVDWDTCECYKPSCSSLEPIELLISRGSPALSTGSPYRLMVLAEAERNGESRTDAVCYVQRYVFRGIAHAYASCTTHRRLGRRFHMLLYLQISPDLLDYECYLLGNVICT